MLRGGEREIYSRERLMSTREKSISFTEGLTDHQMSVSPKLLAQDFRVFVTRPCSTEDVAFDLSTTGSHTALKSVPTIKKIVS